MPEHTFSTETERGKNSGSSQSLASRLWSQTRLAGKSDRLLGIRLFHDRLLDSPGMISEGRPKSEWLERVSAIRKILSSNGRSLTQGALAWIWAKSPQTIPIPGFRTVKQVEENVAALRFGALAEDEMREIAKLLAE